MVLARLLQTGQEKPPVELFFTSWLVSVRILAAIRTVFSLYAFTTIIYCYIYFSLHITVATLTDVTLPTVSLVQGSNAIGRSFSYFTYLAFWGQAFYFGVAAFHGFYLDRKGRVLLDHPKCPRLLRGLHTFFYTTVTTFPFLVTLIYWITMYVHGLGFPTTFMRWGMISVHGINSFFAIVEIILPSTPTAPPLHLAYLLVILSLYLGLAYLSKVTIGIYVYLWLDPQFGWQQILAHVAAYGGAMVIIFICVQGCIIGRNYALKRRSACVDIEGRSNMGNNQPLDDSSTSYP